MQFTAVFALPYQHLDSRRGCGHCVCVSWRVLGKPQPRVQGHQTMDMFIAGFVCKQFSAESPTRYDYPDIPSMFRSEAGTATQTAANM